MEHLKLLPPQSVPQEVEIDLERSKSISNRVLIIQALCEDAFTILNRSEAQDTNQLFQILGQSLSSEIYAGSGGTTYRFLLAYLAFQEIECVLNASESMSRRPIGPLVQALRQLGANIQYLEKEGHPPVALNGGALRGGTIQLKADQSSQFITALMLIAPAMEGGLKIQLDGKIVSAPYLKMTAELMKYFGAKVEFKLPGIAVAAYPYHYNEKTFTVESDWSGASYFWAHACVLPIRKMKLNGLFKQSLQGDSIIGKWAKQQGFHTNFIDNSLVLEKKGPLQINWSRKLDLNAHPDLAQTVFTLYASQEQKIKISGLQTLFHKETDRLWSLQNELQKVGCSLAYNESGTAQLKSCKQDEQREPTFETYQDHRMAMAFSLFANDRAIQINNPEVVNKSFPGFWGELEKLGYKLFADKTS
jgi:3-phosphoshikimate 1-carboxyvinyltransferase